jgi:hypothetical protein
MLQLTMDDLDGAHVWVALLLAAAGTLMIMYRGGRTVYASRSLAPEMAHADESSLLRMSVGDLAGTRVRRQHSNRTQHTNRCVPRPLFVHRRHSMRPVHLRRGGRRLHRAGAAPPQRSGSQRTRTHTHPHAPTHSTCAHRALNICPRARPLTPPTHPPCTHATAGGAGQPLPHRDGR